MIYVAALHCPSAIVLEAYAMDELAPRWRRLVRAHVTICPACAAKMALLQGSGGAERAGSSVRTGTGYAEGARV